MLPLLVGRAGSRREQTRRCHKFDDEHLDDTQVSTTQNVGDIPISTPRPGSMRMRLAADHPWEDPGCGLRERQSRGIDHSVLVIEVQTELHQGPEASKRTCEHRNEADLHTTGQTTSEGCPPQAMGKVRHKQVDDAHLDDKQVSTTRSGRHSWISSPRPGSLHEAFDDLEIAVTPT